MGLLDRRNRGISKTPADTVLLLHGLMLMSDFRDDEERAVLEAFVKTLPELKGEDVRELRASVESLREGYKTPKEAVAALGRLSSPALKQKMFVLAIDMAMSSGSIDESEDEMLEAMQAALDIDMEMAEKVFDVIGLKYAT